MALPPPRLYDAKTDTHLLPQIVDIHIACVTIDHTLATFLPPLSKSKILASWAAWSDQVANGHRAIILQLAPSTSGLDVVAGVVSLAMPVTETGSMRGEVGRLLVSPDFRKRGLARALMKTLEDVAKEKGRWLLLLDTTIGSGAEFVYPKLGYKELGVIPKYGYSPEDGSLKDEMFFYKDLKHG